MVENCLSPYGNPKTFSESILVKFSKNGQCCKMSGVLSFCSCHSIVLLHTFVKFPVASSSFFPNLSFADTAFSAVCEDHLPRLANKCGMKS